MSKYPAVWTDNSGLDGNLTKFSSEIKPGETSEPEPEDKWGSWLVLVPVKDIDLGLGGSPPDVLSILFYYY